MGHPSLTGTNDAFRNTTLKLLANAIQKCQWFNTKCQYYNIQRLSVSIDDLLTIKNLIQEGLTICIKHITRYCLWNEFYDSILLIIIHMLLAT